MDRQPKWRDCAGDEGGDGSRCAHLARPSLRPGWASTVLDLACSGPAPPSKHVYGNHRYHHRHVLHAGVSWEVAKLRYDEAKSAGASCSDRQCADSSSLVSRWLLADHACNNYAALNKTRLQGAKRSSPRPGLSFLRLPACLPYPAAAGSRPVPHAPRRQPFGFPSSSKKRQVRFRDCRIPRCAEQTVEKSDDTVLPLPLPCRPR